MHWKCLFMYPRTCLFKLHPLIITIFGKWSFAQWGILPTQEFSFFHHCFRHSRGEIKNYMTFCEDLKLEQGLAHKERWSLHRSLVFRWRDFHVCHCSEWLLADCGTNRPEVFTLLLSDYRIFTSTIFFESWQHNGPGQCQIIICILAGGEGASSFYSSDKIKAIHSKLGSSDCWTRECERESLCGCMRGREKN